MEFPQGRRSVKIARVEFGFVSGRISLDKGNVTGMFGTRSASTAASANVSKKKAQIKDLSIIDRIINLLLKMLFGIDVGYLSI